MLLRSKSLASLALPLALALLVAGCGKNSPAGADTAKAPATASGTTAAAKKVLHFGNGAEPQDLDPHASTGVPEHQLYNTFFEGLISQGPDLKPAPGMAERWTISDDGLVYTFHLRADTKWSDGSPLTADDFIQSYKRILNPALGAEYAYMLWHVAGAEDYYRKKITDFGQTGFKARDARTVQLTLRTPTSFFLSTLSFYPWVPVPVKVIAKFGGLERKATAWTRPENFVGNGPYRLKEWRPNQRIVAERNPLYWDAANVKIDEIHFHPVELADTEERMFRTGQLHVTYEVPVNKIAVYQREQPDHIRMDPYCGVYFYRFNVKRKPFDDVRVRRALALSIDRQTLVQKVTLAGELPAFHLVPPGVAGYTSPHRLTEDLAEAKRLLAEAGYPDGKGLPKLELLYNTLEKHRIIAEALQQMWRRNLGIDVTLYNQEWKVYMDAQHSRNFQFQRAGWIADYVDPHVFFDMWQTDGGNNDTNWGDPEYDRLLGEALRAKTTDERYAIYQRMEKIFLDAMPVMPIYFYTKPRLVSPKVKGYYTTPTDDLRWKYVDLLP